MSVDFTPLVQPVIVLTGAVVTSAIPIVVPALLRKFKMDANKALTDKLTTAAEAAAGVAYNYALAHQGGLANVDVHNAAVEQGLNYVLAQVPDTVAALSKQGVTKDGIAAMVQARLGKLLATDPSVSAGKPAAA